jgi:plasmid stabilization system protein ParE
VNYRVVFTVRARADAIEQFNYLPDRSPDAASRWYMGLDKAVAKLGALPERHPIAEDESEQLGTPLRQMLYGLRPGDFRILFSIEDDIVTIHYVRHSAQGPIDSYRFVNALRVCCCANRTIPPLPTDLGTSDRPPTRHPRLLRQLLKRMPSDR